MEILPNIEMFYLMASHIIEFELIKVNNLLLVITLYSFIYSLFKYKISSRLVR